MIFPGTDKGQRQVKNKRSEVDEMIIRVCKRYNITVNEIKSLDRHKATLEPRQLIMWYLDRNTNKSLTSIGDIFNRDHATVINSRKKIDSRIRTDERIRRNAEVLFPGIKLPKKDEPKFIKFR